MNIHVQFGLNHICSFWEEGIWTFSLQVNYCHHLPSVVWKLFTFQASSPKPQGQLEPNLAGMFLGWSSAKYLFFVPVGYSTWLPGPIICSDWLKFQRSSSLKLMNWLNPNCKWKIIDLVPLSWLKWLNISNKYTETSQWEILLALLYFVFYVLFPLFRK
jgi:hypothetical protein